MVTTDEQLNYMRSLPRKNKKPTHFRRVDINEKTNKILFALLYSNKITVSELSEKLLFSDEAVRGWVFRGHKPQYENIKDKIAEILDTPKEIIFADYAYNYADFPELDLDIRKSTAHINNTHRKVKRKIFYGLLYVYDISWSHFKVITGMSQNGAARWIYQDILPHPKKQKELEELFKIPFEVLFRNY